MEPFEQNTQIEAALEEIHRELSFAMKNNPPFNSAHEGYAVLLEEVDELWQDIKADKGYQREAYLEAKQIAAMALRYMIDISLNHKKAVS